MSFIKHTFLLFAIAFTSSAQANFCTDQDTLFDTDRSFMCTDSSTGTEYCVLWGYHPTVEETGIRLFQKDDKYADDRMIFHSPAFLGCKASLGFKACIHETVTFRDNKLKAYRYKAPDVWDARSSKVKFEMDVKTSNAKLQRKSHSPNGELHSANTQNFIDCKEL